MEFGGNSRFVNSIFSMFNLAGAQRDARAPESAAERAVRLGTTGTPAPVSITTTTPPTSTTSRGTPAATTGTTAIGRAMVPSGAQCGLVQAAAADGCTTEELSGGAAVMAVVGVVVYHLVKKALCLLKNR